MPLSSVVYSVAFALVGGDQQCFCCMFSAVRVSLTMGIFMSRSSRSLLKFFALVLSFSLFAVACGDDDDEEGVTASEATRIVRETADGTLVLSTFLPLSGSLSSYGPGMRSAAELAVIDINEAGGVLDSDVKLMENVDTATDQDVAVVAVDKILDSEADALLGPAGSGITNAVFNKVTGRGLFQCAASNTALALSNRDDNGYYVRTAPSDDLQGPALADIVAEGGHTRIAIMARNDDYGKGFKEALEKAFGESNLEVVESLSYDAKAPDYTAEVKDVKKANPDAIIVIGFSEGAKILAAMIEHGIGPGQKAVYTADGMQDQGLVAEVDPKNARVLDGLTGTTPSAGTSNDFLGRFGAFAPEARVVYVSQMYDCAIVIALAAIAAGSDDPAKIKDEIVGVTRDGEKCVDFAACKPLLEEGKDIDYDGVSGPIEFDAKGDPEVAAYDVWTFQQGEIVTLRTVTVSKE